MENKYSRLFRLESEPNVTIAERGVWCNEKWQWVWNWRNTPRGRAAGELEDLQSRVGTFQMKRGCKDKYVWNLDPTLSFNTKKLRELVEEASTNPNVGEEHTSWLKMVPRKVCIFIWRVKKGRIPSRTILDKMGIDLDSVLCPRCKENPETLDHALVNCPEVKNLWKAVGKWWNKNLGDIQSIEDLLQEEPGSHGNMWVGVKWALTYLIWSHRNRMVFENGANKLGEKFFELQRRLFEWFKSRSTKFPVDWKNWLVNPSNVP